MGKLLKYEIKGSYKFILAAIVIMSLINVMLLTRIGIWMDDSIIALISLTDFGSFITILLYIINCFKRELYEDRGYLTFTLPMTGNQILGAKLIAALIWFAATSLVIIIFISIFGMYQLDIDMSAIKQINFQVIINIIASILISFMQIVFFMLTVYFSIILSKIALKNKKLGGLISFIIFIAINTLFVFIIYKLIIAFPYSVNLASESAIISNNNGIYLGSTSYFSSGSSGVHINIVGFIFNLATIIALFLGCGYLIDNKIDL